MRLIIKKIPSELNIRNTLAGWPLELPLIFLGSSKSRFFILALKGKKIPPSPLFKQKIHCQGEHVNYRLPFTCGYLGAFSYDFCTSSDSKSKECILFEVKRSLVWDQAKNDLYLCEDASESSSQDNETFDISYDNLKTYTPHLQPPTALLKSALDENGYKDMCQKAQDMIRQGRFYQINLLQYFDVTLDGPMRGMALSIFDKGGAYSCSISLPFFSLFSYSPEQFCHVEKVQGVSLCTTSPIKGTIACPSSPHQAKIARRQLLASQKNEAELNMITELMRNDLGEIAKFGSVKVLSRKKIFRFNHVYHLKSKVQAELREDLRFGDFFSKVAPAGSITGAPKVEVQKAILEFERRGRGYFMGNAFYFDPFQARFDSSVLIRTAVTKPNSQELEFAAGSGIVLGSDPQEEWHEIKAKTRILST